MSDAAKTYLLKSLFDAMQEWNEKECETDHWLEVGWVGDSMAHLMAQAALLVMQANAGGSKAGVTNGN